MFNISHSLWNSLNCRSLRFSVDSIRWLIDGSLCDQWINVSRVSLTSYLLVEVSRQNVRLCRSILVVSSASFSEEFVLLTESVHPSNSSVSLVTNTTSRHESMTTKVSIIFTNSPQQAASSYTIDRQSLRINYRKVPLNLFELDLSVYTQLWPYLAKFQCAVLTSSKA